MTSALPAPVARYLELARREGAPVPGPATVIIETDGWMRRPGMPRIPLAIRMLHRLGHDFVHEIRIGRGIVAIPFGGDAYVDGSGFMKVGRSVSAGPAFDQGAAIAMWCEALGFPAAWEGRDDVRWEPVDDATARLVVPGPEGAIPITVGFDPATGCPARCDADRYKADGPKTGWSGLSSEWRRRDGVLAPGRFAVQWSDEPSPWLDIRVTRIRAGAPVEDALRRARATLRSRRG